MRIITYTIGTEVRKILVDSQHDKFTAEKLIKKLHLKTKLEIKLISTEQVSSVYLLSVVQPIGNMEISETELKTQPDMKY